MHAGVVTSVPMLHATPAAFITHTNHRNNGPQMQRIMMETVNPTMAIGNCNGRNYPGGNFGVEHDIDYQARIADGYYGKWTVLKNEIGKTAEEALAPMADLDPDDGHKVMGCFPDQASNMPYRGVDSTYSGAVLQNLQAERDAAGNVIALNPTNEIGHRYTPEEVASIPKMKDIVKHSIEFLGKSDKGFFMMYEQGDIDWSAHANQCAPRPPGLGPSPAQRLEAFRPCTAHLPLPALNLAAWTTCSAPCSTWTTRCRRL
jgi:alkaline phosphatase